MEKPLFESIKPTKMEPPPWVWDRIAVSITAPKKESHWLPRLISIGVAASLFISMGSMEIHRMKQADAANQTLQEVFLPSRADLLVSWDI